MNVCVYVECVLVYWMGLNFSACAISIYIHVSVDDTHRMSIAKTSLLKLVSILNWEMNNTERKRKKKKRETERKKHKRKANKWKNKRY